MSGSAEEVLRSIGNVRGRSSSMSPFSVFHELLVAEFDPLIELDSSNGLSLLQRDTVTTTGSGSVTESDDGGLLVASGTTAGSTAVLSTKERGRYQPGIMGMPGQAFCRPVQPSGDISWFVEYGDGIDAMRLGEDATTGLFVRVMRKGVWSDPVPQASWNVDPLDGTGRSEITLNLERVNVVRNPFSYYGSGPEMVAFEIVNDDGSAHYILAHEFEPAASGASFSNPKLPLRGGVDNGSSATDFELFIFGRQFAVLGRYNPNRRNTPDPVAKQSVTADTTQYLGSYRKKTERKSSTKSVKVRSAGGTASGLGRYKLYLGGTLTGTPNPTDLLEVPAGETALERDTAATGITGGTLLKDIPVAGGSANNPGAPGIADLGVDIPEGSWVSLFFEDLSGQSNDIVPTIDFQEEW